MSQYLTAEGVPTTLKGKMCNECPHMVANAKWNVGTVQSRHLCSLSRKRTVPNRTACILYPTVMGWTVNKTKPSDH